MEEPDRKLKNPQDILAAEGPTVLQHQIVLLLDTDTGQLAKNVQAIGQILELHELDLPVSTLLSRNGLEGDGSVAVSTAAVMEDNVDFFHDFDCAIRLMFAAKSIRHAMWITKEVQCVQGVPWTHSRTIRDLFMGCSYR